MAYKPFEIPYDGLPHLLKEFVEGTSVCAEDGIASENGQRKTVNEREYYTAFESLLQYRRYREDVSKNSSSIGSSSRNNQVPPPPLTETQHRELASFHMNRCLTAWVFDHAAHEKYAYFPSNAYPIGSTMEYSFFMRQWMRNVNYSHVRRLYDRSGDFAHVLTRVDRDLCPCHYLLHFNVFEQFEYKIKQESTNDTRVNEVLCLISIENELMMRSDFFTRRKEYYQTFNTWFYDRFLDPRSRLHDALKTETEAVFPFSEPERRGDASLAIDNAVFYGHLRYEARTRKRPATKTKTAPNVDVRTPPSLFKSMKYKRLRHMTDVCRRLMFGRTPRVEKRLLVRCEDYTSGLYSPVLKVTSCRHVEESVTFEQRRCGDEIQTEIRTCKKCGRVKAITN